MRKAWKREIPLTIEQAGADRIRYAVSGICGGNVPPLSGPERTFLVALINLSLREGGYEAVKTPLDGVLDIRSV